MNQETQKNLLKIVEKNYDDIADDFSETRKKYLWPELLNLTEDVKDGDRILDAGCGNGRLIEAFRGKKVDYLGVDNSVELLKTASETYPENKFILGNILDLGKIKQLNFDRIFCIAVLHHLPGRDLQVEALRQLKNKIGEHGKIIITVWNLWSRKKFRRLILKFWLLKLIRKTGMMSRRASRDPDFALRTSGDFGDILFDWKNIPGKQRYYHAFRKCELKKNIKKSGLKIERIYKDKYNYYLVLNK